MRQLNDTLTYGILWDDPTRDYKRRLQSLLRRGVEQGMIPQNFAPSRITGHKMVSNYGQLASRLYRCADFDIRHVDDIAAVRSLLVRTKKDRAYTDLICEALEFVLNHNAFKFGDRWIVKRTGMPMGTLVAPTLANLFLAIWEENYVKASANPFISPLLL